MSGTPIDLDRPGGRGPRRPATAPRWRSAVGLLAAIGLLLVAGPASAVVNTDLRIDPDRPHQRIDGFGGFGGKRPPWSKPPIWDPPFVERMVDDLGVTILRMEVPTSLEPTDDDGKDGPGDPKTLHLERFNLDERIEGHHLPLGTQLPYIKAMAERAKQRGEPLKLIATVWSPPPWMKVNRQVWGTNRQRNRLADGADGQPDYREEFAEYCLAYVKLVKQHTGVDVYALSVQNEPHFAQRYQSSVYTPDELAELIRIVGRRFAAEGIETRLFGPEDVSDVERITAYVRAIGARPASREQLDILAVHGYGQDGDDPNREATAQWRATRDLARRYHKPLWMTETSGYADDWDGAIQLAESIHAALTEGDVSAWVWWSLSEAKPTRFALTVDGEPTHRYFVSKHFYRFIRPGAVRVAAASDDEPLAVSAYTHAEHQTLTAVLINRANHDRRVKLHARGLTGKLKVYRTTAKQGFQELAAIPADQRVHLPGRSITTVVAEGFTPPPMPKKPAVRTAPRDRTVEASESVAFAVELAGPFPMDAAFQWLRDGEPIDGATLPVLELRNVNRDDDGAEFAVRVRNEHGEVVSEPATLRVKPFTGVRMVQADAPPKIDGEIDAQWRAAPAYGIERRVLEEIDGPKDLSGEFRVLWDDRALYLLFEITDDRKQNAMPPDAAAFENDSVELYLEAGNRKRDRYGPGAFQFIVVRGGRLVEEVKHDAKVNVETASLDLNGGGYRVEVAVPWKTLGMDPTPGAFVGFDVHVNDSDRRGERTGKIAWFAKADIAWQSPAHLGVAQFVTAPAADDAPAEEQDGKPKP